MNFINDINSTKNLNYIKSMGSSIEKQKWKSLGYTQNYQYDQHSLYASVPIDPITTQQLKGLFHRNVGPLLINCPLTKRIRYRTGILLSSNLVLTAALNIFDSVNKIDSNNIRFYPGQSELLQQPFEVETCFYPENYKTHPSISSNIALLKLKQKVSSNMFIPLQFDTNILTKDTILTLIGYSNKGSKIGSLTQYVSSIMAEKSNFCINQGQIAYKISALSGMEGSPLMYFDKQTIGIIGIYSGGVTLDGRPVANIGRLITKQVVDFVNMGASRMGAERIATNILRVNQNKASNQHKDSLTEQSQSIRLLNEAKSIIITSKKYDQALELLLKAYKLSPQNLQIIFKIGACYFELYDYEQASIYFKKGKQLNPTDFGVNFMIGGCLTNTKKYTEALPYLQQALHQQQNANGKYSSINIYGTISKCYYELNMIDEAEKYLKMSVDKFPKQVQFYPRLVQINHMKNNYPEAFNNITKFYKCTQTTNRLILFQSHVQKKQIAANNIRKELIFQLKCQKKLHKQSLFVQFWMRSLQKENRFKKEQILVSQIGSSPAVYILYGKLLFSTGQTQTAQIFAKKSGLSLQQVYIRWSDSFFSNEMHDKCEQCIEKCLQLNPQNRQALTRKQIIKKDSDNTKGPIGALKLAALKQPQNIQIWLELAKHQILQNLIAEASASLNKAFEINNNNSDAHFLLGVCYEQMEKAQQALKSFLVAEQLGNKKQILYIKLGHIYNNLYEPEKAEAYFTKAISVNQNSIDGYTGLGNVHYSEGNLQKAEEYFLIALKLNPSSGQISHNLGLIELYKSRLPQAIDHFVKAIQSQDRVVKSYLPLVACFQGLNQYNLAIRYLKQYLGLFPGQKQATYLLGLSYLALQNFKQAENKIGEAMQSGVVRQESLMIMGLLICDKDTKRSSEYFTMMRKYIQQRGVSLMQIELLMKNVNDFVQQYRGNDNKGSEYLSKVYMLLGELQNSKSSQYS